MPAPATVPVPADCSRSCCQVPGPSARPTLRARADGAPDSTVGRRT
ncbi:Hypothetical protein SCLAV_0021 [Streptomyces clavuligerus]|uniref:Uncharacterized protein n=1 Tax=Streptomyces clavuligerus TaxID=1901 RepID=E2Q5T7_STRCL|nr:Hypothetical protein SCLAV_0021 [Streptomyces clavuligerus]